MTCVSYFVVLSQSARQNNFSEERLLSQECSLSAQEGEVTAGPGHFMVVRA